jgi:hypothetical protein
VASGRLEFCILGEKGKHFGVMPAVFLRKPDGSREEIWRDRARGFRPWKVEVAELDGDSGPEVAVGVYKTTRHDPLPARRLFVYDWNGYCLFPKWLGSSLALPLVDFSFVREAGKDTHLLLSVENDRDTRILRKYRWNGFGFTATGTVLDKEHEDLGETPRGGTP